MKKACRSFRGQPQAPGNGRLALGILLLAILALGAGAASPPPDSHSAARSGVKPGKGPRTYLQTVGPAPLRVEPRAVPVHGTVLPPLAKDDPVRKLSDPAREAASTNHAASIPAPFEPSSLGPTGAGSLLSGTNPEDAVVTPIVTPSMLMQYFRPMGTNGFGAGVAFPVFVPPTAPVSRPSSATYRSE